MAGPFKFAAAAMVFFWMMAFYAFWRGRRKREAEMIERRLALNVDPDAEVGPAVGMEQQSKAAFIDEVLEGTALQTKLQGLLGEAGDKKTPGELVLQMILIGGFLGFFLGLVSQNPVVGVVACLSGFLPYMVLDGQRRKRAIKIGEQLPQALEIMTISLRAGQSLAATIAHTGRELQPPISEEFTRCAEEHELGRTIEESLMAMSRRLASSRAMRTFVVAVLVLQQTGGNLIEIIERIIGTLRAQSQYQQKLRAMTAPGKSQSKMLSVLPGAFILLSYAGDPDYVMLLINDPTGVWLGRAAIFLWAGGIIWTRSLVKPMG